VTVKSAGAPARERKILSIEQLRGVAALAVVVCHVGGHFYGLDRFSPGPGKLFGWLGQWGVALFFVISGFCIRLPMARARALDPLARLDAGEFVAHRFLRIAPPYWLAIAGSIGAGMLMRTELVDGAHRPLDVGLHVLALHTLWAPSFNSINGVFWTIGVEAHFYAAYLLLANRRLGWPTVAVLLIAGLIVFAAASVALTGAWRTVGQAVFITALWQWCLGAMLADWYVRRQPQAAGAVLMVARAGVVLISLAMGLIDPRLLGLHLMPWALPFAAAAMVGLFVVGRGDGPRTAGPLSGALSWLGRISYSLYLFHPVALSLVAWAQSRGLLAGLAGPAAEVAGSLVLAWGSYRLVERPLLTWRARLKSTVAAPGGPDIPDAAAA
jgi:peptidoglycan/LPS O-acetylase OafA/YrhL